jgi:hypothetical protein
VYGLTDEQLRILDEDGFLIIRSFFTQQELQPVINGINVKVDRLAQQLVAAGQIADAHADKGFTRRLAAIEKDWPGAAVLIHQERYVAPELCSWAGIAHNEQPRGAL